MAKDGGELYYGDTLPLQPLTNTYNTRRLEVITQPHWYVTVTVFAGPLKKKWAYPPQNVVVIVTRTF